MKKFLATAALTSLAVAGGLAATGTAAAETGGNSMGPSFPLGGLLETAKKPPAPAEMPAAGPLVGGLVPGQH
ncbi:hypothetical protein [Streptomyces sp. NPDC126499]|uniref:hypothetical protein n=1 Tax=Streptomyces sp. NPDC126499 TaxID=3155314 RepID=UPI003331DD13